MYREPQKISAGTQVIVANGIQIFLRAEDIDKGLLAGSFLSPPDFQMHRGKLGWIMTSRIKRLNDKRASAHT